MFIGHLAFGFAAKRVAPRASLPVLIAAPLLPDMLWPIFLLLGWERVRIDAGNTRFTPLDLEYYPWSHSLLLDVFWATGLALVSYALAHYKPGAAAVWLGLLSHWVLDWITHRPDMPLYPGSPKFGLGLWNSIAGTMVVEFLMLGIGVWLYTRATVPRDRIGQWAFAAFVALLLAAYIGDRFAGPPPSVGDLAWTGVLAMVLVIPWTWWFDSHLAARI